MQNVNPQLPLVYIDLLKRCICNTIYEETYVPLMFKLEYGGRLRRIMASLARLGSALLPAKLAGAQVFLPSNYSREQIETGAFWPQKAHSMIGLKRMTNVQDCMQTILREGIPGDLIETGVWRGGTCIFMRGILMAYGVTDRRVYVADSFAGLPKPDDAKYPADVGDRNYSYRFLAVSLDQVQENFRKYNLLDDQVIFLKGWFKDTLPTVSDRRFALIRLDGDMYESTMDALRNLYPLLSPGGFCVIDDYFLEPCRRAVHEYRTQNDIHDSLVDIDGNACFWRKEPKKS
ncbi:MAG: TylF/MycF family methyltransferase [Methylacidiphilales bacterium]|nr:TylF/MycF family methyltransferase [Candidatus Methylacidiphilales bacterium]